MFPFHSANTNSPLNDSEQPELAYEEIRDSMLDKMTDGSGSNWSKEMDELSSDVNDDGIHYYIQPVNEYENTEFTLYENYKESREYKKILK